MINREKKWCTTAAALEAYDGMLKHDHGRTMDGEPDKTLPWAEQVRNSFSPESAEEVFIEAENARRRALQGRNGLDF